ncbi:MAG: DUF3618 domain-containing protein [Pseudomonadota bacterium]|nr:DUF3618 domain-containing protein [Pseudomonadota bacterium]
MTETTTTEDPAIIEQDIRRTQEDMSRTVDKIGDQLTFRNVFNSLLDKADENNVDARYLIEGARRNPVALGLIAAGAIWLVSDKDAKFPTLSKGKEGGSDEPDFSGGYDADHRDYVTHMSSVEMREGEDALAYQRRRDIARANFLMVERGHDEDESSFRQRLDGMTEKFREKRRAWTDSTSQAASRSARSTRQTAQWAASRTQEAFYGNPLVGGILAAAVGAALGSSLPVSRQEQEKLGRIGEKARDLASEQKEQLASQVREKKDELLQKADEKLQSAGTEGQQQTGQEQGSPQFQPAGATAGTGAGTGGTGGGGESSQTDSPFILGDRNR